MRLTGFRLTRRRLLMFVALLLVAVPASFWVIPWLLMPHDLWRMQGEWTILRMEMKDNDKQGNGDIATITGSRLRLNSDATGELTEGFEKVYLERPAPQ